MHKTLTAFALAAAGALLASAPAVAAKAKLTGEERLAKMLEGREAGEPVSCIGLYDSHNLRVIDRTALVYRRGGTIYVNRPHDPGSLGPFDVLVMERTGSQLCKQDTVRTVDQSTGIYSGSVFLGDFVPYKKVG